MPSNFWQRTVRFRAFLLFLLSLLAIPVALICIWAIVAVVGLFLYFGPPKNWDQRSSSERDSLVSFVQEIGHLEPFPNTARDLQIEVRGNPFTRRYLCSFNDEPENIQTWLKSNSNYVEEESPDGEISLRIRDDLLGVHGVSGWIASPTDRKRVVLQITDS